jgi:aryl-alcohol dehydrogenase
MKATAAVVHEAGKSFEIEYVELAEPKADEVLVKVIASGVCHTDEVGRLGAMVPLPAVLGHEGAGIVEKTGANVKGVQQGDHVVLTYASCGECSPCAEKKPYICVDFTALNCGGKMKDGTSRISRDGNELNNFFGQSSFATYAVVNVNNIVRVDKDVDISLLGPLGCGVQTGAGTVLGYLNAQPGTSIAVYGIGAVGLSAIMGAKVAGCKTIIAVGGTPEKLKLALTVGATHTVNRREVEDVGAEVKKLSGGGTDYSVDTSGAPEMMLHSLHGLKDEGQAAWVAIGPALELNPMDLASNKSVGYVVEGGLDPQKFITDMVSYYKAGNFPIDKIITFYELKDIDQAFADSHDGKVVKPVIRMPH